MVERDRPRHALRSGWFVTTRWSVVAAATGPQSGPALEALETLCRAYWYPLYVYARRLGQSPQDAEDSVQSFLARCLEKHYLAAADPTRGRFRSFLLVMFRRFMANEWDKARARRRGGRQQPIAWDALSAEEQYALEPQDQLTPERAYDRSWAMALLQRVLARLESEHATQRPEVFAALKGTLTGGSARTSYAELGTRLGMTEAAVKVAAHRLRNRYRQLLEQEIAHTVANPADLAGERRELLAALG